MPTKFKDVSKAEWLARVEKDLKGKPLAGLNFTVAGHTFTPFHHREDLAALPVPVRQSAGWRIGQEFDCSDPAAANKAILRALNRGVSEIHLSHRAPLTEAVLDTILDGVFRDIVEIVFVREDYIHNGKQPEREQFFASNFYTEADEPSALAWDLFRAYDDLLRSGPYVPVFHLFSKQDHFATVAKLRAMRLCWHLITESHGEKADCKLCAHLLFDDAADDNTRMIAASPLTMAAITGGADTVMISPANDEYDTAFAERIATNIHHLLAYESGFDKVADPAAGSYFLEKMTDHYAQKIWAGFQQNVKHPRPGSFQNP